MQNSISCGVYYLWERMESKDSELKPLPYGNITYIPLKNYWWKRVMNLA